MVKNLHAMWETQVRSLGHEDPLKKQMAIHSAILSWEIPETEGAGGLQSTGSQKSQTQLTNYNNNNKRNPNRICDFMKKSIAIIM